MYENEHELGEAFEECLPKFNLERKDIFITTKLNTTSQGSKVPKAIENSLTKLKTAYIDLYLIHFPGVSGLSPSDPKNKELRTESWKHLERYCKSGKLKSIGVSNYTRRHLEQLLDVCEIVPAVNQVEFNPYCYQDELLEYCKSKSIALEAYSPHRWAIQHGVIVIPKSQNPGHIASNINVFDFEIDEKDMKRIDGLNKNLRLDWDPSHIA
ncbi:unnamed protein product [Gordionus sp. m RMFG-2023]